MLCSLIVASLFLGSARGLLQLRIKQQVLVQGPKSPRSIHEFINDLHEYLDLTFYGYVRSNVVVEPHVDSYAISGYILFREDAALGPLGLKNAETSRFEDICSELNKSLLLHKDTSKENRRIRGRQLRVSSIARPSDGTPGQKHRGLKSIVPTVSPTTVPSAQTYDLPTLPLISNSTIPMCNYTSLPIYSVQCVSLSNGTLVLNPGEFTCSQNNSYRFGLTIYGELGLFDTTHMPLWSSGTTCPGKCDGVYVRLQVDGNLLVNSTLGVLWESRTAGHTDCNAILTVGNDGVATIRCNTEGYIWSTATALNGVVNSSSLERKVMAGYQGWFFAKGDGGIDQWVHWGEPRIAPSIDTVTIDFWPDMSECDNDELYRTDLNYSNGANAPVYSAFNTKTVERHCRWMQDYGLDGIFAQRFIREAVQWTPIVDKVLSNIRSGSEKFGRVFAVMYDISNGENYIMVQEVINDWMHLVDNQNITKSGQYLRHRGKPLLAIWGLGFASRVADVASARMLIDWFRNADEKYQVTLLGGVPAGWRDLGQASKTQPEWADIYRSFDVISPWTVGAMNDLASADYYSANYIKPDLQECDKLGIDYLPVVFPGFSAFHLGNNRPLNQIPRNGGTFFWRQFFNAMSANSSMVYIAMFDEVNEGTAIFKVAERQEQLPLGVTMVTLDQDLGYPSLPSDWYLQLAGAATNYVHSGEAFPVDMPIFPTNQSITPN